MIKCFAIDNLLNQYQRRSEDLIIPENATAAFANAFYCEYTDLIASVDTWVVVIYHGIPQAMVLDSHKIDYSRNISNFNDYTVHSLYQPFQEALDKLDHQGIRRNAVTLHYAYKLRHLERLKSTKIIHSIETYRNIKFITYSEQSDTAFEHIHIEFFHRYSF